jgi:hypothetical protein
MNRNPQKEKELIQILEELNQVSKEAISLLRGERRFGHLKRAENNVSKNPFV